MVIGSGCPGGVGAGGGAAVLQMPKQLNYIEKT
jgi:hypothetical protein